MHDAPDAAATAAMPGFSLGELAKALGARLEGDGGLRITGAAEPQDAGPDRIALAMKPEYAARLAEGRALAALLHDGADWRALGLRGALFVPRPRFAMAHLTRALDPGPDIAPGIHPTAVIDPSAEIGDGAAIGPLVVVGAAVRIGARARIAAHCSIGAGAEIGPDALLHAGVRLGARVRIGARFIAQPGAVIGGDGFSFVTPDKSAVEQMRETLGQVSIPPRAQGWTRIHSLGSVQIGDDVEIGANSTIDRGTIRDTEIGSGTRIDNLVQVGHNVRIGRDCMLCGQVGIAGSAVIGDRVVLGGQVGVNDNIHVGDDVIAAGGSDIYTNAPAGRVLMGSPAIRMEQQLETYKALRRLPRLLRRLEAAEKAARHKSVPKTGDND